MTHSRLHFVTNDERETKEKKDRHFKSRENFSECLILLSGCLDTLARQSKSREKTCVRSSDCPPPLPPSLWRWGPLLRGRHMEIVEIPNIGRYFVIRESYPSGSESLSSAGSSEDELENCSPT